MRNYFAVSLESDDVETRMMTNYRQNADWRSSPPAGQSRNCFIETRAAMRGWPDRRGTKRCHDQYREQLYRASKRKKPREVILGGIYRKRKYGRPLTRQFIHQVHFSKAFIGIDGWQVDTGFTTYDAIGCG